MDEEQQLADQHTDVEVGLASGRGRVQKFKLAGYALEGLKLQQCQQLQHVGNWLIGVETGLLEYCKDAHSQRGYQIEYEFVC